MLKNALASERGLAKDPPALDHPPSLKTPVFEKFRRLAYDHGQQHHRNSCGKDPSRRRLEKVAHDGSRIRSSLSLPKRSYAAGSISEAKSTFGENFPARIVPVSIPMPLLSLKLRLS